MVFSLVCGFYVTVLNAGFRWDACIRQFSFIKLRCFACCVVAWIVRGCWGWVAYLLLGLGFGVAAGNVVLLIVQGCLVV